MYGKQRQPETTIYVIKNKTLRYFLDVDSLTRAKIKTVFIKTDTFRKNLVLVKDRYVLTLNPYELENINSSCSYVITIVFNDKSEQKITGKIIIVR